MAEDGRARLSPIYSRCSRLLLCRVRGTGFGGGTPCLVLLEARPVAVVDLSLRDGVNPQALLARPGLHQVLNLLEILVDLMKIFAVHERVLERFEVQNDGWV